MNKINVLGWQSVILKDVVRTTLLIIAGFTTFIFEEIKLYLSLVANVALALKQNIIYINHVVLYV